MADEGDKKGFLRLNHFHGLRLESQDFQVGEKYHVDKKKLHNKVFHGAGIIEGYMEGLRVLGRRRGDMSIDITPGYGIDGEGNDIFLWEPEVKTIDPGKYKLPQSVYIVIKFVDEPTDFVVNAANPKYKGHRRVLETCKVEIVANEPTIDEAVELARVRLTPEVHEIKDASNPYEPGDGEIDLRYRPRAGVTGTTLDPDVRQRLHEILDLIRREFTLIGLKFKLHTARDIRDCAISAMFLAQTNLLPTTRDAMTMIKLIASLEEEMVTEFVETYPELAEHRSFLNFKENVHAILHLFKAPKWTNDEFSALLGYQGKACEAIRDLGKEDVPEAPEPEPTPVAAPVVAAAAPAAVAAAAPPPPPPEPEKPKAAAPAEGAKAVSWQQLQELGGELPDMIFMDGKNFKLTDKIDMLEKASEAKHAFSMDGHKDSWSTNQEYTYPDGTRMKCKGRAHVGGHSQWKFLGLEPGRDLVIAKRIDYAYSGLVTDIYVDGQKVGAWKIEGQDRKNRWRNWLFKIPGEFVKGSEATIKQVCVDAEREVNMFKLWCYQAVE